MANRQSECIKVRNSAFSIRLDLLGTFCIKAKGAEEKSMAKGGKLHQWQKVRKKTQWQKVGSCIKAKGAEEKSMAKGRKLHQGKRCDRKVNDKKWEAASMQKLMRKVRKTI
jgi:hypothetical protein